MNNLKEVLLNLNLVEENEYLTKYCDLILKNLNTPKQKGITNSHHIIPAYYYRYNQLTVNNSKQNLINLIFTDHIKAHFYLENCSTQNFKGRNIFAIYKLCGTDIGKKQYNLLKEDKELNIILECKNTLFSEEHKNNLKNSAKNRISKNGHISKTGYVGGVTDLKVIHTPEGKRTYVEENLISELLNKGYSLTGNSFKKPEGFNKSDDFRKLQSSRLSEYYKNNPDFKTKSKKAIRIFKNDQEYIFKSVKEFEIFLNFKQWELGKGVTSTYIKLGYIKRKNCIYNGWNIEYYAK